VELASQLERFRSRGLGVAALSYDSVAILKDVAMRKKISVPLLADPESKVIRAFGLLNEADYKPGEFGYGVPYPGTFVSDASGVVRSKFFEKTYAERQTAGSVLALAGDTPAAASGELRNDLFTLRLASSNAEAAAGQRVTLVLDFELKPNRHAYAPGVQGYRPLRLRLDPHPLVTLHETAYPASKPYHFAPLDETVPVFEGRFRVTQDVTLAGGRQLADLLKTPDPRLELTGSLDYQVCSDTVCFAPGSLPVRFTIKVVPLDRERSPEAIRHKPPQR